MNNKITNLNHLRMMAEKLQELDGDKQDVLTGQPGQTVGFDATGHALAVPGWSNPNLLDNWYFADPINQRGLTEYTGSNYGTYAIDRWKVFNSVMSINGTKIEISSSENTTGQIQQPLEESRIIAGKTYTLSVLVEALTGSAFLTVWGQSKIQLSVGINIFTFVATESTHLGIFPIVNLNGKCTLEAVKLEPGPVQTLAHQDADGNWVLNDPPPNYALELAKCQRYYETGDCWTILYPWPSGTIFMGGVPFKVQKRIIPTTTIYALDKDGNKLNNKIVNLNGDVVNGTVTGKYSNAFGLLGFKMDQGVTDTYSYKFHFIADANL